MASRTTISLVDDLDGSEAAETVMFGLGGQLYELDLTTEHAAVLRGIFGPYIGAARKVAASTLRSTRTERGGGRQREVEPAAVRAWAAENKIQVSPRGRVPQDVVARFKDAQSTPAAEAAAAGKGSKRRRKTGS